MPHTQTSNLVSHSLSFATQENYVLVVFIPSCTCTVCSQSETIFLLTKFHARKERAVLPLTAAKGVRLNVAASQLDHIYLAFLQATTTLHCTAASSTATQPQRGQRQYSKPEPSGVNTRHTLLQMQHRNHITSFIEHFHIKINNHSGV